MRLPEQRSAVGTQCSPWGVKASPWSLNRALQAAFLEEAVTRTSGRRQQNDCPGSAWQCLLAQGCVTQRLVPPPSRRLCPPVPFSCDKGEHRVNREAVSCQNKEYTALGHSLKSSCKGSDAQGCLERDQSFALPGLAEGVLLVPHRNANCSKNSDPQQHGTFFPPARNRTRHLEHC